MNTWLMEGCPLVFLLEVVSSPQREEKRLRRLLKVRGMAWFRLLMLFSVRADTCDSDNDKKHQFNQEGIWTLIKNKLPKWLFLENMWTSLQLQ